MGIILRTICSLIIATAILTLPIIFTALTIPLNWFVNLWEFIGMGWILISIALYIDKNNFR